MDEEQFKTHPAYGMVGITRCTGSRDNLFGSSIKVESFFRISIRAGEVRRSNCDTNYYGSDRLIEVDLSPNQFTELITTLNVGSGIPCTIYSRDGKIVESSPRIPTSEEFKSTFREDCHRMARQVETDLQAAAKILEQKDLKKADRESLKRLLESVTRQIHSNMPFVQEMFEEAMDKTVAEAKAAVDAQVTGVIARLGIQKLQELTDIDKQAKQIE